MWSVEGLQLHIHPVEVSPPLQLCAHFELASAQNTPGVVVIGATNRPDQIDPALLRPGRLGTLLYVPLPNAQQRLQVLQVSHGLQLQSLRRIPAAAVGEPVFGRVLQASLRKTPIDEEVKDGLVHMVRKNGLQLPSLRIIPAAAVS